jgi:hypothetical protein
MEKQTLSLPERSNLAVWLVPDPKVKHIGLSLITWPETSPDEVPGENLISSHC